MIDKEKLLTVNSYAGLIKKTTQYVYYLLKKGEINGEKIDGVQFVVDDFKSEKLVVKANSKLIKIKPVLDSLK